MPPHSTNTARTPAAKRDAPPALRRLAPLLAVGLASALLHLALALRVESANSLAAVGALLGLLAALFALYAAGHRLAARAGGRGVLATVLLFAALFRLLMLSAGLPRERPLAALADDLAGGAAVASGYETFLLFDNDVWRYLWDGHAAASGLDPFTVTPQEVAAAAGERQAAGPGVLVAERWWDVLDRVSFRTYTTVYPPTAQLLFRLAHAVAPGSVFALKGLLALCDLATCWLLARLLAALGRPPREAILYAWNPLAVTEVAGSGHVDALGVALLVAGVLLVVRARPAAGPFWGAAVWAKPLPLPLLPLAWRRLDAAGRALLLAALAALWLPYRAGLLPFLDGLAAYTREWRFNGGPYRLLAGAARAAGLDDPDAAAQGMAAIVVLGAVVVAVIRDDGSPRHLVRAGYAVLAGLVLLAPSVMPWYALWPLPLAIAAGDRRVWPAFTALVTLSYLYYVGEREEVWWLVVEYGGVGVVGLFALAPRFRRLPSA